MEKGGAGLFPPQTLDPSPSGWPAEAPAPPTVLSDGLRNWFFAPVRAGKGKNADRRRKAIVCPTMNSLCHVRLNFRQIHGGSRERVEHVRRDAPRTAALAQ